MSLALHSRCTVAFDTPVALAIVRTLQRFRFGGGCVARLRISLWVASAIVGLRPRPLASAKPASPACMKRFSHSTTTGRLTPTRRAVSSWLSPSARCRMICARHASRRIDVGRPVTARSALRCASVIGKARIGRAMSATIHKSGRFEQHFARHYTSQERRAMNSYTVHAQWDAASHTWWTDGEDLPGLTVQADSFEELVEIVLDLAPELLHDNAGIPSGQQVGITI